MIEGLPIAANWVSVASRGDYVVAGAAGASFIAYRSLSTNVWSLATLPQANVSGRVLCVPPNGGTAYYLYFSSTSILRAAVTDPTSWTVVGTRPAATIVKAFPCYNGNANIALFTSTASYYLCNYDGTYIGGPYTTGLSSFSCFASVGPGQNTSVAVDTTANTPNVCWSTFGPANQTAVYTLDTGGSGRAVVGVASDGTTSKMIARLQDSPTSDVGKVHNIFNLHTYDTPRASDGAGWGGIQYINGRFYSFGRTVYSYSDDGYEWSPCYPLLNPDATSSLAADACDTIQLGASKGLIIVRGAATNFVHRGSGNTIGDENISVPSAPVNALTNRNILLDPSSGLPLAVGADGNLVAVSDSGGVWASS